jgi:hypothetical protein
MFFCVALIAGSLAGLSLLNQPQDNNKQSTSAVTTTAVVAVALRHGFDLPPPNETRYVKNEVLLDIPAHVPDATLDRIAARHAMMRLETVMVNATGRILHRWRIDSSRSVRQTIRRLSREQIISGAGPNYLYTLEQDSPGFLSNDHYAPRKLQLSDVHRIATGDGVLIALIDTKVDAAHRDLAGVIAENIELLDAQSKPHTRMPPAWPAPSPALRLEPDCSRSTSSP